MHYIPTKMGLLLPQMFICFSLFHISLPLLSLAQTNGNIAVGVSLTATASSNSSWLSPSGEFGFGFQEIGSSGFFSLCIWYDKIPEKTIVWYPKDATAAPSGSKVQITSNGGIVLTDPQGNQIYMSESFSGSVSYGVMNDTGNLQLFGVDSGSEPIWDSFSFPSDTLLLTQALEKGSILSSSQSETNFSLGRFQLRIQDSGDVWLNTINLPTYHSNEAYWTTKTAGDSNTSEAGRKLVFDASGSLYILRENGSRLNLSIGGIYPPMQNYHRVKLNFDGVLVHYVYQKDTNSQGWSPVWFVPNNICRDLVVENGLGVCGYNSICILGVDSRPTCFCPAGFHRIHPNDHFSDCAQNFSLSCDESQRNFTSDLFSFEELINTGWPTGDYALLTPVTEQQCQDSCLYDCLCAAATFRSGKDCWKKKLPLSNGQVGQYLPGKALIKVPKQNLSLDNPIFQPQNGEDRREKDALIITGSVLLGTSVFVNFLLAGVICLRFYLIQRSRMITKSTLHQSEDFTKLRCFAYKELVEATDSFKEELGRGHFGVVYKGMVANSPVAVKKLMNSLMEDSEREFQTEVNVIGQTHHKNLVQLLGYCHEGHERLLVYEFLSNGPLSSLLFGIPRPGWAYRCQIASGIARGLLYLHEECSTQIIHCDIKPQNVLLDDHFSIKISDFGLAKLLRTGQSKTNTAIRGTKGYVAPDWFRNLPVTVKVDVYSFGVLLLEILCCRRNTETEMTEDDGEIIPLSDQAYDCYVNGTLEALVDGDMELLNDEGGEKLKRMVMVAIWCIQEDPDLRPSMWKITQMLEGAIEVPNPPCPFPFTRPW